MAFGCAVQARSRAGLDSRGAAGGGDRHGGDGRGTAQRLVPREGGFPLGPRAVARERDGGAGAARGGSGDAAGDVPGSATNQGAGEGPQAQGEGAGGDHGAPCAVKKTRGDLPSERGRMISLEDRQSIARAVGEAHRDGARLKCACAEAGITVRTLQRWKRCEGLERGDRRPQAGRRAPAHALSEAEREQILQIAHEPRFAELPPARIVPMLADEGVYVANESSFTRVLRTQGQARHRGRAKAAPAPPSAEHARGHRAAARLLLGHDVPAGDGNGSLVLSVPDPGPVQPQDRRLRGPRDRRLRACREPAAAHGRRRGLAYAGLQAGAARGYRRDAQGHHCPGDDALAGSEGLLLPPARQ